MAPLCCGLLYAIPVRKFLKVLLWLVAGIGALLAVLVTLLLFVDVNLYRAQIERHVSNAFGREVVSEGPLTLERSLAPRFAVKGLKIANPAWASRPYLASVEKFDIRVGLLPLLNGELEILSLEFRGVDLLLEVTTGGQNNFTFGDTAEPAEPTLLPAIEQLSLHDAKIGYRVPDLPTRSFYLERVRARKVPGEPLELEAQTAVNTVPVNLALRAEPRAEKQAGGTWKATLFGELGRLSFRIEGSVVDPGNWDRGEYQLHLEGPHLDDLEKLSGYPLPDAESLELDARIGFNLDDYLTVSEFTATIGDSDLHGSLDWDIDALRPAFKIRLESQQLDIDDMGLKDAASDKADSVDTAFWDDPLDPTLFAAVDLDIQIQVGRLDGLAEPLQGIQLNLYADHNNIRMASSMAALAGAQITADMTLPWGERIAALERAGLSLRTLLKHTEFEAGAEPTDGEYLYATTLAEDQPLTLSLSRVEASVGPDSPISIRAEAAVNEAPLHLQLRGESLAALLQQPTGPWQGLEAELRGADLQLDASGSVARPLEAAGFDIRYALSGSDLSALLPLRGAFSLSGRYLDQPGRRLIDELQIRLGNSDLNGRVVMQDDGPRPKITARLESRRWQLDELLPTDAAATSDPLDFDRLLELGELGNRDLDVELRVQRLNGLDMPVADVLLSARSRGPSLELNPFRATVDGTQIDAKLQLPWGQRLTKLGARGLSIRRLSEQVDLALEVRLAEGKRQFQTEIMGQDVSLTVADIQASARPGEVIKVTATGKLNHQMLKASLATEPLAGLLQRPRGPWRDLALELQTVDFRLRADGSVERPLEAAGFDIRYTLKGAEIDRLLPLLDLILPIEGAYSVAGRVRDRPDGIVIDDLKIASGRSDIGGRFVVDLSKARPRVDAELHSDQIYLHELVPDNETKRSDDTRRRVIPEYDLPIEQLLAFDGELVFEAKRLRTNAGDLGDLKFQAALQDGVFKLAPFRVRGWSGARVEGDVTMDATQTPPFTRLELIAEDLNYGLLLKQAGVAEIVDGRLDVTLRLSGEGRTRREFLSVADGQFVVVAEDGKIGSRRLDLWGADLVTTMLSSSWRSADVTKVNCLVVRVSIDDGLAVSDDLLLDTQRITIGAAGTLDLETEALNLVFAPRPKRASLVSLTNPVKVTGTLAEPEVSVTVLPRGRFAAVGGGLLAGLVNPAYLVFALANTGSGEANPCVAAVDAALEVKGVLEEPEPGAAELPPAESSEGISLFTGCSRMIRR